MQLLVKTNPQCLIKIEKGLILNKGLPEGFVITDKNVYEKYSGLIKGNHFIIDASEKSKSLENYSKILGILGNEDTIISLGGGVVGDLAGFVASTYKRGIKLIHVPTSLLAMVDSSIGGKNGVNLGEKKNYVGTIYQPQEVLIDPLFLETLPEKEIKNGLAEVIKYSYLFGSPNMEKIKIPIDAKDIEEIIFNCCKNKAIVVEKDPLDKNYRYVLNFGHTIGHGIELLSNLGHGEAISIGMIKELEIGNKLDIVPMKDIEIMKGVISKIGLPLEIPQSANIEEVIKLIKSDKKGKFVFSLSKDKYSVKVEEKEIREVLKQ